MKILHIQDVCANAYIMSKFYKKMGHESYVYVQNTWDPFSFKAVYKDYLLAMDKQNEDRFIEYALSIHSKYDLIQVHGFPKLFHYMQTANKRCPFILHYWGSDARNPYTNPWRKHAEETADLVLGGNPDLPQYIKHGNVEYIPIPIDTDIFYRDGIGKGCFTFTTRHWHLEDVKEYLAKNNMNLQYQVIDRDLNAVKHSRMPSLIRQYDSYIDLKIVDNYGLLPAHSATGLQALACGLKVLNHKLQWEDKLPEEHKAENVCKRILELIKK